MIILKQIIKDSFIIALIHYIIYYMQVLKSWNYTACLRKEAQINFKR